MRVSVELVVGSAWMQKQSDGEFNETSDDAMQARVGGSDENMLKCKNMVIKHAKNEGK